MGRRGRLNALAPRGVLRRQAVVKSHFKSCATEAKTEHCWRSFRDDEFTASFDTKAKAAHPSASLVDVQPLGAALASGSGAWSRRAGQAYAASRCGPVFAG